MNDDLNDALSAAYDKMEETADAGQGSAPERVEPEAPEGTQPAETPERARDEQGRFAAAEKAAEADGKDKSRPTLTLKGKQNAQEKAGSSNDRGNNARNAQMGAEAPKGAETQGAQIPQGTQGGQTSAAQGTAVQSQPLLPPAHWLGAAKKHWDRLPAEVRDHIHRDGEQVAQTHGLTQALAPYAQVLTSEFGGADRGIAAILSTWQFARTQPIDFTRQFLQSRGIDPRVLAGEAPSQAQPSGEPADPVLAPVLQRMQQLEAAVQHFQQQPLIAQQNQIQTDVESFGAAVNQDGSVAHPYFNDVKPIMASLMGSGTAKTLKEAYDMAVYANPAIRADLMATEQAKQAEQRRRAAEAAKGAAASIAGSPGHSGPGKAQTETVDATLERAWERAVSGARA